MSRLFLIVLIGILGFSQGPSSAELDMGSEGLPAGKRLLDTPSWTSSGQDVQMARFGISVSAAGDVNGDEYPDVIVGASYQSSAAGWAFLYYGGAAGLSAAPGWMASGGQAGAFYGSSVASAGDVNGDGYSDIIVGAKDYTISNYEGRAYLYLGSSTGPSSVPDWTSSGESLPNRHFGRSVFSAGDVNGDGYSDVIVGAVGRAYVYYGSSVGLSTTPDWISTGEQVGENFGYAVASAGDVDNDGYADVIVGARDYDATSPNAGRAYVYHGSAGGLLAAPAWTASGSDQTGGLFGASVASAGDVNGDGYADVIVGAMFENSVDGRAYVYLGSASGLSTSWAWSATGSTESRFGTSVSGAGDVNADGYADVVVGASDSDTADSEAGEAFLYLGGVAGLSASPAWSSWGDGQAGASFGFSVAAAGDVNGDHYSDVVVGAPSFDSVNGDEGKAYLYQGVGDACIFNDDCPFCHWCNAGTCEFQAAGTDLNNQCPPGECLTGDCDGAGACEVLADGVPCLDDGLYCTGAEECHDTVCLSVGNPCIAPSDCDETNDICAACGDGTVSLATGEECDPGAPQSDNCCNANSCHWTGAGQTDPQGICAGAPECQRDVCDGSGSCTLANAGDGTPCTDDGQYCTGAEACQAGACVSPGDPCPGTECNTCNEIADDCHDPAGTACTDDGLYCTGAEACDGAGNCLGSGDPCPGTDCHNCNETQDNCLDPVGTPCTDDGQFCTGLELCDASNACVSQGNPCLVPADCDEVNDVCGDCGDGVISLGEACDPGAPASDHCCDVGSCQWIPSGQADPQSVCSGAPECQLDVCDGTGSCTRVNLSDGTSCSDDGLFCNGPEECSGGVCMGTGDPCSASECNHCNEAANNCHDPAGTACADDGLFCTGAETCDGAGTCAGSGDPCSDPTTCDEQQDACVGCQSDADCSVCLWCDAGTCTSQEEGSDLKDDCEPAECLTGDCDGSGACGLLAAGTSCSDGEACNGEETCDAQGLCQNGQALDCDDGLYCTGAESCDPVQGCQAGDHPCDDQDECTLDSCDEATDSCSHEPDPACQEPEAASGCGCGTTTRPVLAWVPIMILALALLNRRRHP